LDLCSCSTEQLVELFVLLLEAIELKDEVTVTVDYAVTDPAVDAFWAGMIGLGGFADAHAFMTDLTDDGCFGLWGCWFAFGHVGIAPFVNELYRYSGIDSVFIILGG